MARGYRHIQEYEEKLLELKAQGLTVREIGERFGFTYEQTHDFLRDITGSNERLQLESQLRRKADRRRIIKSAKKIRSRSSATSSTEKTPGSNHWKWRMN